MLTHRTGIRRCTQSDLSDSNKQTNIKIFLEEAGCRMSGSELWLKTGLVVKPCFFLLVPGCDFEEKIQ